MKKLLYPVIIIIFSSYFSYGGTKEEIQKVQRYVLDLQKQLWELQEATFKTNQQIIKLLDEMNKQFQISQSNQAKLSNQIESLLLEINDLKDKIADTNQKLSNLQTNISLKSSTEINQSSNYKETEKEDEVKKLYQSAYADYQRGKYDLALAGFSNFLKLYSNSDLADNAQYWIGECQFSKGNYLDAIIEFDNLITKYPTSDKIAAAHLKKALSYLKLEKKAQAVVELQFIIQQFPTSDEAQLAKEQLKELGFE